MTFTAYFAFLLFVPPLAVACASFVLARYFFQEDSRSWHYAMSACISVLYMGYIALFLSYTKIGITLTSISASVVILLGLALLVIVFKTDKRKLIVNKNLTQQKNFIPSPALIIFTFFFLFVILTPYLNSRKEGFTEFYFTDFAQSDASWREAQDPNKTLPISLTVHSSEVKTEAFRVFVFENDSQLFHVDLGILNPGDIKEILVELPPRTLSRQNYRLDLIKDSSGDPYRRIHFEITSLNGKKTGTLSNREYQVSLQQYSTQRS